MAAPGQPTQTYFPYVGWYYYRVGTTVALKASRAHFFVSWGIFDPNVGTFPTPSEVQGSYIYLNMYEVM